MPRMNQLSDYRTTWHNQNDCGGVTYVSTEIVKWDVDNVTLNSGSWRTVTTKRKLHQASQQFALGFTVSQVKGEWFVIRYGCTPEGYSSAIKEHGAITLPFHDGMTFPRGRVRGPDFYLRGQS